MNQVSFAVRLLGYAGLIPFVVLMLGVVFGPRMTSFWMAWALTGYGAAIFSFLGAIHWGVALCRENLAEPLRNRALVWGVIPSLLSAGALMLAHGFALLALATIGIMALVADIYFQRLIPMPKGWIRLRIHLTLGASACLAIAGIALASPY